jgi:hypothetical protein
MRPTFQVESLEDFCLCPFLTQYSVVYVVTLCIRSPEFVRKSQKCGNALAAHFKIIHPA